MKNISNKQLLLHQKSATYLQQNDHNAKLAQLEKKHTFSEIISEFKQFLKSVLLNELFLNKAFKIIQNLKQKYEKDIFAIYEANLKIQTIDSKKNQNFQNNIKLPLTQQSKVKLESVEFLPLESALREKEMNYKITLNGCHLKQELNNKMTVKSKKTLDTEKSSEDCDDDKQITRWKSMDQKNVLSKEIKQSGSQKNLQETRRQKQKVTRGIDYLYK